MGTTLHRTPASTNPIESCLSIAERVARNVKRRRVKDQALRWTTTGRPKNVKGFRDLKLLPRKLNPSLPRQEQVA
jgi:hypothetical protein